MGRLQAGIQLNRDDDGKQKVEKTLLMSFRLKAKLPGVGDFVGEELVRFEDTSQNFNLSS